MKKTCPICGKSFDALINKEKYCSDKCAKHKKYYKPKPMLRKICINCERIFMTRRFNKKFCSNSCKNIHHKVEPALKRCCLECGEEFTTGKTYQFYCSKKCYKIKKNERSKRAYRERRKYNEA